MSESRSATAHVKMTAEIVSAFVSNNSVRSSELPAIIEAVFASVLKMSDGVAPEPLPEQKTPAVPVKKSVTDEYIICLEDGKKFKSLKRHLSTAYNMTPDDYRAKWGLSRDYPMVAPSYASARSSLARQMGLGRKRDDMSDAVEAPAHAEPAATESEIMVPPAKRRGRPRTAPTPA